MVLKSEDGITYYYPVVGLSLRDILRVWWNADSNPKDLYNAMRLKYGTKD